MPVPSRARRFLNFTAHVRRNPNLPAPRAYLPHKPQSVSHQFICYGFLNVSLASCLHFWWWGEEDQLQHWKEEPYVCFFMNGNCIRPRSLRRKKTMLNRLQTSLALNLPRTELPKICYNSKFCFTVKADINDLPKSLCIFRPRVGIESQTH